MSSSEGRDASPFAVALVERGVSWEEATRAARRIIWEECRRAQRYPCSVAIAVEGRQLAITADVDPVNGALTLVHVVG